MRIPDFDIDNKWTARIAFASIFSTVSHSTNGLIFAKRLSSSAIQNFLMAVIPWSYINLCMS